MTSSAAANIPLSCKVCSRRNDYSDLSHLLTHIASKGHLSNYYRLKLQSGQDAEAQRIIDEYDDWYDEWGFQDMMQERMNQKDSKKRANGSAPVRRASTPGPTMASVRGTPAPTSGRRKHSHLRNGTVQHVDPSLQHNTRQTQLLPPRLDTPQNNFIQDTDYIRGNGAALPPLQSWNFSRSHSPIKQETVSSDFSDVSYETAPRIATRRRRAQANLMSGSNASVHDDNTIEELVNDNTKLKGVVWPGMDLFDSATPDMKRKRNQKKHGSVLLLLQATSEDTEAKEMVFRDGRLEVERTITGNPESDDSLISGESEPEPDVTEKKPARRRVRAPLAEKNTNNGRILRKSERETARRRPLGRPKRTPYPELDEEEEEELTYGDKKSRTGLSIHRDNSGPDITFSQQPLSMNFLASGFDSRGMPNPLRRSTPAPPDFSQSNPLNVETFTPRTHFRQPSNSWGQLSVGFRPVRLSGHNVPLSTSSNSMQWNSQAAIAPQTRPSLSHQYFGQSQSTSHNEDSPFQPHPSTNDLWDHNMFGFTTPDLGMPDMTFSGTGEMSNPLFFSSKSDDEETISAANSEK